MSFFSSLVLFYPGKPPVIKGHDLQNMASALRDAVGVKPDSRSTLEVKWGERIDQDYESTNETDWDESGIFGTPRDFAWDLKRFNLPWSEVWADSSALTGNVYRAYVSLGLLTKPAVESLRASDPSDDRSFIAPDCASIQIGPICPATLSTEELACTGMVAVTFAGNGYFTWGRNMADYAAQYRDAPPVCEARRICRERFPAVRDDSFERIADHLGDLFLNRSSYVEGDWILSISETG